MRRRIFPFPLLIICIDSFCLTDITDSDTGELVYGTSVVRIDRQKGAGNEQGWVVQTVTDDGSGGEGERTAVLARSVVNAAGLK